MATLSLDSRQIHHVKFHVDIYGAVLAVAFTAAGIVCIQHGDWTAIPALLCLAAALLHDTMEDTGVAMTPETELEFRSVGTTLLVTPNINSDRTVTLRLLQENSSINAGGASIPVVLATGAVQNVSVDVVSSRSVSGTFVAKDDKMVAIGGLIEEQDSDVRSQVPVLGNIPVLGLLFRRQTTEKTRHELVILIRPHVISTPADGEAISQDLLRNLSLHPALPDARGGLHLFSESDVGTDRTKLK